MEVYAIDHVQLAMPAGGEERARAFYGGVLGLEEERNRRTWPCRAASGSRRGRSDPSGVEADFRPRRIPRLLVRDLAGLVDRCDGAGYPAVVDEPIEGAERVYVSDPFGNRIELIERSLSAR